MRPVVHDNKVLLINDERKLLQFDLTTLEQVEFRRVTAEADGFYCSTYSI